MTKKPDLFNSYEAALKQHVKMNPVEKIYYFEIEDKFFEKRIKSLFLEMKIETVELRSPLFITPRSEFLQYLKLSKKPFMKTFYQRQRVQAKSLIDADSEPLGGKWSFDTANRLSLPEKIKPPTIAKVSPSKNALDVMDLVDQLFAAHPGKSEDFWLPTTRVEVSKWFQLFLDTRLKDFGPYEDAIPQHSDFIYHSVISPFLNVGLIVPKTVIAAVEHAFNKHKLPIELSLMILFCSHISFAFIKH